MSSRKGGEYQIGVVGSFSPGEVDEDLNEMARLVGVEVAKRGHVLVFGLELDGDSLSAQAARGAKEEGGVVCAVVYGSKIVDRDPDMYDVAVYTASERGGPRESVLIASSHGVIGLAGGSGTMMEMLTAYMNRRPVVVMEGTGGWSDQMAGEFFDDRKRAIAHPAKSPQEAVGLLINLLEKGEL